MSEDSLGAEGNTDLDDYSTGVLSKVEAISNLALRNLFELERVYREAKDLLLSYEHTLRQCARHPDRYPEQLVNAHRQKLSNLTAQLHAVTLKARQRLFQERSGGRDQTRPSSSPRPSLQRSTLRPEESLAEEISKSLGEMAKSMQDEIARSDTSYRILERSSKRLRATGEQYTAFSSVITTSRRLIVNLWRREWNDRMMIYAALLFYSLVVLYILSRRLWMPLFLWQWLRGLLRMAYETASYMINWVFGTADGEKGPTTMITSITNDIVQASPSPSIASPLNLAENITNFIHSSDPSSQSTISSIIENFKDEL